VFRTRITELMGMCHPILAGGLMWLSDACYVAAVVNAGGMAFITARSFEAEADFAAELELCSRLAGGKPFGVNLSLSRRADANMAAYRQLGLALDAGVRHFETAGPSPKPLFEAIHAAGGIVIHKCAYLAHALKAEEQGADAITLVGMEAGGHPGMHDLPATLLCSYALERLRVPLALGGGIGHGRQIAAALALGCDAVVIGTRFLGCDEVGTHENVKQRMLASGPEASTSVLRTLGNPVRVLHNETARQVAALEEQGARAYEDFGDLVLGITGRDGAYRGGDVERGLLSLGASIGFVEAREPVAAVMETLMRDAAAHAGRLGAMLRTDNRV
jgi:nitronate monooxygenase